MEVPAQEEQVPKVVSRAWYGASIAEFLKAQPETVVGQRTTHSEFAVLPTQTEAWLAQIRLLKEHLAGLSGSIFFEFNIPRMGCDAIQKRGLSPTARLNPIADEIDRLLDETLN